MDLSFLPVIDNHMHIIPPRNLYRELNFAITAYPVDRKSMYSMISHKMFLSRLATYFGMKGASEEEVMAERNRRYDSDPTGYIRALMKDANIKGLICDLDSPISAYWKGNYRTDHDVEEFIGYMEPGIRIGRIIRIEIVANLLLEENLPFDAFLRRWRENMLLGAEKFDIIAIKSVIAYFTGLAVRNPSREEACAAYEAFLRDRSDSRNEKIWRDYMIHQGLELCHELSLPMQIHTGYGDAPYGDLRTLNPTLLIDFLKEDLCMKVPVVLLHGGYPYCREIGILASQFPQVYLDFSEFMPLAGYAAETAVPMILETAPYTKVLYGTDGGGVPETVWLGAVYSKEFLGDFLENLVRRDYLSEKDARDIADAIFWRNALEVYPKLKLRIG